MGSKALVAKFGRRRDDRREDRRDARDLRRHGPEKSYYGGSETAQRGFQREAVQDVETNRGRERKEFDTLTARRDKSASDEQQSGREYQTSRQGTDKAINDYGSQIGSIGQGAKGAASMRDAALGKNQLTGTAESVLQQRANALAASPTIGQATETALLANRKNAQEQLAQQTGLMNRQARGLAGSMGEGGALAMQQAMASAGAGAADLAAMNQNQLNQLGANMRFDAAKMQRGEDVDTANMGLNTRMGAAEQERQAQLGFADTNAAQSYDAALQEMNARQNLVGARMGQQELSNNRNLQQAQNVNALTGAGYEAAAKGLQNARQNQQFIEGTALTLDQQQKQAEYEAAKNRGFTGFMGRLTSGLTNMKAAMDATDLGPRSKLIPNTQPATSGAW